MKGGLLLNRFLKGAGFYLLLFIIIVGIVQLSGTKTTQTKELEFSKVYKYLTEENISRIHFVDGTSVEGTIKDSNTKFTSYIPDEVLGDKLANEILDQAIEGKLVFDGEAPPQTPWFVSMLPTVLLIGFMIIIWFVFMNQSQGGGGKVMSFGKSKARVHKDDEKTRVTFKDVAGLTEEKEDLQEVVDFLKNMQFYSYIKNINEILTSFNPDINVDRVRALGMVMLYRQEFMILYGGDINANKQEEAEASNLANDDFFTRNYDLRFNRSKFSKIYTS